MVILFISLSVIAIVKAVVVCHCLFLISSFGASRRICFGHYENTPI